MTKEQVDLMRSSLDGNAARLTDDEVLDQFLKSHQTKSKVVIDPVSGEAFVCVHEGPVERRYAVASGLLLLLYLALFLIALVDVWSGQYRLLSRLGYSFAPSDPRLSGVARVLAFAFIGGGLGSIINEFRSFLLWHAEHAAFGARFIWKSIGAPWMGGTLALLTIALIRSGTTIVGGISSSVSTAQALSTFAIAGLAGYGSRDVSKWLDGQVKKIFTRSAVLKVPLLEGRTLKEAKATLKVRKLRLGEVGEEMPTDVSLAGKVLKQSPSAGAIIHRGGLVDITVGTTKKSQ
jgi:hypothetical protein